jgi:hypothetical protein
VPAGFPADLPTRPLTSRRIEASVEHVEKILV